MRGFFSVVVCFGTAISLWSQSGTAVVIAGRQWDFPLGPMAPLSTPFAAPNGLAIGPDGTLYVADQTAAVVVAIKNGVSRRFAGNGTAGYSGDGGPAIAASLKGPGPLAVGPDGTLYIADLWNYVIRAVAPNGTISTFAGNGTFGACADGSPATGPCVGNIGGLATDSAGNLYFSDASTTVFEVRAGSGTVRTFAGGPAATGTARLFYPESLAIDAAHNVYVLQNLGAGVAMVSPNGDTSAVTLSSTGTPPAITSIAVSPGGTLYATYNICHVLKAAPGQYGQDLTSTCAAGDGFGIDQRAIAVDAQNNVYVADDATQTVRQTTPEGVVTTLAGSNQWFYSNDASPADSVALGGVTSDFAFLPSGDIVVAGEGRVRRITIGGAVSTLAGFGTYDPIALAVAANGNVLFADNLNCVVRQIDSSGRISVFAGRGDCVDDGDYGPAATAGLAWPRALTFDRFGNLYVATAGEVRRIDPGNNITTIAGGPLPSFADNVSATQSNMDPRALAVDRNGNLLIADILNKRIRTVNPAGVITTVAGNGNMNLGGDDGPALAHAVGQVWSLAVDSSGNVWFADSKWLRQLGTDGSIRTIQGGEWGCPSCLLNVKAVRLNGSSPYVADWPFLLELKAGLYARRKPRSCTVHCGNNY